MLKKLLFLFLFILPMNMLFAQTVSVDKASTVARTIYLQQYPQAAKILGQEIKPELAYTCKSLTETYYYVFNIPQGGFVIVSGNEAVAPVLGYSFEGSFLNGPMPPACQHWLKDYQDQIAIVIASGYIATPAVKAQWNDLAAGIVNTAKSVKSVNPLLYTTWDQGKYYNADCPVDAGGSDGHTWAGCVPTAMAQIMNYWRWPDTATGSYSYVHPDYGTLSADFGATPYHWSEMPLELTTYNDALAELLFHLGVSVDLDYGPDGSGMFNHKAAYSLRTYFGYSPSTEYIFRDTATHTNWKGLVLAHLDSKTPLYYAGWADTINVSGHAFVCDGYQDTTWFHMNWGWSGSYNGYFMLDNLTPSGNDFTLDHELILNIVPAGNYPSYCGDPDTLTAMGGTIGDGSGPVHNYINGADCFWLIAPSDSVTNIKLTFKEFDVVGPGDKLTVYNGKTTASPVLGTFSGSSLPAEVTANGQYMLLHFESDSDSTAAGWLAEYRTTIPVYCTGITTMTPNVGLISDNSGPREYHNNSLCRWQVQPAGVTSISFHIGELDLGPGDYIEVYNQVAGTLIAHITGDTLPDDIICPSGKMLVVFKSDAKETAQGFSAMYYVTGGLTENEELTNIEIFPNPANELVKINGTLVRSGLLSLQLFNANMAVVKELSLNLKAGSFQIPLPVDMLTSGLYFLRISSENEQSLSKIVINK